MITKVLLIKLIEALLAIILIGLGTASFCDKDYLWGCCFALTGLVYLLLLIIEKLRR